MLYRFIDKRGAVDNPGIANTLKFRNWIPWLKDKKWIVLSCALSAVLLVSGTFAFLRTMTNTVQNQFEILNPEIKVGEDFDGWNYKQVWLENTGNMPGVARAMIIPVLKDENDDSIGKGGVMAPLTEPDAYGVLVLGDFTFEFNPLWRNNWFYKDGYFYCRTVLNPGDATQPLLERVSLTDPDDEALGARYEGVRLEVEVLADIIQADGDTPYEAWGVIVNGNNVSPILQP